MNRNHTVEGIKVVGSTVPNQLILNQGWNLVGPTASSDVTIPFGLFDPDDPDDPNDSFLQVLQDEGITNPVQFWDPVAGSNGEYIDAPLDDDGDYILEVLRGYWIFSVEDITIIPDPIR